MITQHMADCKKAENDAKELQKLIHSQDIEYVRYFIPDIHGILKGKVFPTRNVDFRGEQITICALTFTMRGPPVLVKDHEAMGFGNVIMRPIPETLIVRDWKSNKHGSRIAQVMCDVHYTDGKPVMEDMRRVVQKQISRLNAKNLSIYSGTEFEFRLYNIGKDESDLTPTHPDKAIFISEYMNRYENFMIELDKRLKKCNIDIYTMHSECGRGQIEIPLAPSWDMDIADHSALFKMMVKETAIDQNMRATFMTKDLSTEFCNGSHFNHSVWHKNQDGTKSNAFRDESKEHCLSDFGRHWLAGLLHHAPALTALGSSTVNCYRRVGTPWAPHHIVWGRDDRLLTMRLKVGARETDTYIENRIPGSAANPYLVLAGVVAAGLDGVERQLDLQPERSELGELPRTLDAALEALKSDTIMCEALGQTLINWFVEVKEEELNHLKGVDVTKDLEADYERERECYFRHC